MTKLMENTRRLLIAGGSLTLASLMVLSVPAAAEDNNQTVPFTGGVVVSASDSNGGATTYMQLRAGDRNSAGVFVAAGDVSGDAAALRGGAGNDTLIGNRGNDVAATASGAADGSTIVANPGTLPEPPQGLLLPAVQGSVVAADASQNGLAQSPRTTVPSADTIRNPQLDIPAIGGDGIDVLRGGAGNDTLLRGAGIDILPALPAGAGPR